MARDDRLVLEAGLFRFDKLQMGQRGAGLFVRLVLTSDRIRIRASIGAGLPPGDSFDRARADVARIGLFRTDYEESDWSIGTRPDWLGLVQDVGGQVVEPGFFLSTDDGERFVDTATRWGWTVRRGTEVVPNPLRLLASSDSYRALMTDGIQ